MSIIPSKFHKHVPVIGFIDTGADTSMIDPSVLSSDSWENHSKQFRAVNGETFEQYDNHTDPLDLCLFWEVQEWLLVNLLMVSEELMKMKWPLTLDFDFLGEDGLG